MASSPILPRALIEVIDLVSDDSDSDAMPIRQAPRSVPEPADEDHDFEMYHTPPLGSFTPQSDLLDERFAAAPRANAQAQGGTVLNIDGEDIFIPDENLDGPLAVGAAAGENDANVARDHEIALALHEEPSQPHETVRSPAADADATVLRDHELAMALEQPDVTAEYCLQRVLDIFPDINHEYVITLYNGFDHEGDYEILPGQARLDNIIEQLVSGVSYPKQEKGKQALKRKRQNSIDRDEMKRWEQEDRQAVPHFLKGSMQAMLKAEFPEIPINFINEKLATHQHLYQAYVALSKAKDDAADSNRPYGRGRPSTKHLANADTIATNCGWPELLEELIAARMRIQRVRVERAAENAKKQAENDNLQRAIAAGETTECTACYDELPMNRQIHCNGSVAHFSCFDCAQTYIKSEVGESRCRVLCTAGCGSSFPSHQLNLLSDKQLIEKLSQLQQEKDIRDAGLDDLEECPFCDYKAILPPIEEDFEFRCANAECEKVSCRRCKSISHIPVSCEQHAKDNKVNSRHKIEEAMTAALIRSCNKCKKQFIKEYGCNKMSCPSCGNLQCYCCSTSLKDYNHFDQAPTGGRAGGRSKLCPLYDNVEERHEREVKEAEATARAQVVSENPDVTVDDLEIKVSDAVKKATADRIRQGGGPAGVAMPYAYAMHDIPHQHAFRAMFRRDDDDDHDDEEGDEDGDAYLGEARHVRIARLRRRREALHHQLDQIRGAVDQRHLENHALDHAAAQQAAAQRFGIPGRLQARIPLFGMQPAAAPNGPQPQQPVRPVNFGAPPVPQAPQHLFPARREYNDVDEFAGGGFGFGLDGAANRARVALPNAAPANNNNLGNAQQNRQQQPNLQAFTGAFPVAVQPPDWAPQGQAAYMPEHQREHRQNFQMLEQMRVQHDQLMLQRERQREGQGEPQREMARQRQAMLRHDQD